MFVFLQTNHRECARKRSTINNEFAKNYSILASSEDLIYSITIHVLSPIAGLSSLVGNFCVPLFRFVPL